MTSHSREAESFVSRSRTYLLGEYLPKIRFCLLRLSEEEVWWRPNDVSNSIGNLIIHLAGNARQWILSGVAGEADVRDREGEFRLREGLDSAALNRLLTATLVDVDRRLETLDHGSLQDRRTVQGREMSVLEVIYHVVEHFAMHTGQIIYITKLRTGEDLAFYEVEDGIVRPRW